MPFSRRNWLSVTMVLQVSGRIFVLFLALLSASSIAFDNLVAHASGVSTNPLVVVATDVTNQTGYCFEVFKANVDTAFASTTQVRCPAGTLITTRILPLSQASVLHEPYVVLPSSQASTGVREKAVQEIQRLFQANTTVVNVLY
jgi:hypothetical protein